MNIKKNIVEHSLDIIKCLTKSRSFHISQVLLLAPVINGVTKAQNITIMDLLSEFLSSTNRNLGPYINFGSTYILQIADIITGGFYI